MSMHTTVAHLGLLRVRWISMSSGFIRIGSPGPLRIMALIMDEPTSILASESQLHRPVAIDLDAVPAALAGLQVGEDAVQQFGLKDSERFGREIVLAALAAKALLGGHLLEQLLHVPLQAGEILHLVLVGEAGQRFHVDEVNLGILGRLFQLLDQTVDGLQLILDLQRFFDRHRLLATEYVLGGEFFDLVLVSQMMIDLHQLPGETAALIDAIPEAIQVGDLLLAYGPVKRIAQLFRRLGGLNRFSKSAGGQLLHTLGLVGLQDFLLALFEHGEQGRDARSEAGDLRRINLHRFGKLLFGEVIQRAKGHHMLERRRNHIRLLSRGHRITLRIVPQIGVDDSTAMSLVLRSDDRSPMSLRLRDCFRSPGNG